MWTRLSLVVSCFSAALIGALSKGFTLCCYGSLVVLSTSIDETLSLTCIVVASGDFFVWMASLKEKINRHNGKRMQLSACRRYKRSQFWLAFCLLRLGFALFVAIILYKAKKTLHKKNASATDGSHFEASLIEVYALCMTVGDLEVRGFFFHFTVM